MSKALHSSFTIIELVRKAAAENKRAPSNDAIIDACYAAGGTNPLLALNNLVDAGTIKIELAGRNWRIITILPEGPSTAPEPAGRPAWRTIDASSRKK